MSIELARRALPADDDSQLKRSLELSAYFTVPKLEASHRQLALVAAMMFATSKNNLESALGFANRILENGGSPRMLERVCTHRPPPPIYLFPASFSHNPFNLSHASLVKTVHANMDVIL